MESAGIGDHAVIECVVELMDGRLIGLFVLSIRERPRRPFLRNLVLNWSRIGVQLRCWCIGRQRIGLLHLAVIHEGVIVGRLRGRCGTGVLAKSMSAAALTGGAPMSLVKMQL